MKLENVNFRIRLSWETQEAFLKTQLFRLPNWKIFRKNIPKYPISNQLVKLPAAWLIEFAGWKGKKEGNVGVHKNQSLVLVNLGDANGKEIYDLSKSIIEDVNKIFNIQLEREVNIIL